MKHRIKLVVFDLDWTLWDGDKIYKDTQKILKYCRRKNLKVYIVSYNLYPEEVCRDILNIHEYIKEYYNDRNKNKIDIIRQILNKDENQDIGENEVVFFDDQIENFCLPDGRHRIKTYLVNPKKGLTFTQFINNLYYFRF